ncbi:MAG TPA: hypothetical protein V6D14_29395 [Coleofasciculaceae cyanobacterium]|jgi:hypothetical protein
MPFYQGQSNILIGVSLGLEKPATVAVVDAMTGQVLAYRSIRQLLGEKRTGIRCAPSNKDAGIPQWWLPNHLRARRNPPLQYFLTGQSGSENSREPSKVQIAYPSLTSEISTAINLPQS